MNKNDLLNKIKEGQTSGNIHKTVNSWGENLKKTISTHISTKPIHKALSKAKGVSQEEALKLRHKKFAAMESNGHKHLKPLSQHHTTTKAYEKRYNSNTLNNREAIEIQKKTGRAYND